MTIELVFLLTALWVLVGCIDAWVLSEFGRSGWRWLIMCVLTGPLSLSILYDQIVVVGDDSTDTDATDPGSDSVTAAGRTRMYESDEGESTFDCPDEWPRDDPEGRLLLLGHRGLSER